LETVAATGVQVSDTAVVVENGDETWEVRRPPADAGVEVVAMRSKSQRTLTVSW